MSIMKKKVVGRDTLAYGFVKMPRETVGQEVVVIYEDDFHHFTETLRNAYYLSSASENKTTILEREFKKFKEELSPRIAFMERSLASLMSNVEKLQKEKES